MPTAAPTLTASQSFAREFTEYVSAGYQCIYICTSEEHRVEQEIVAAVKTLKTTAGTGVMYWDEVYGFQGNAKLEKETKYRNPCHALEALADPNNFGKQRVVCIFRDLDEYFKEPPVRRRIRSLCEGNKLASNDTGIGRRLIVILSPSADIHPRLRAHIATMEFKLPDEAQISYVVEGSQMSLERKEKGSGACDPVLYSEIVRGLRGLTATEAENCLARSLVRNDGFKPGVLASIKDEKAAIIKKSETLTYLPETQQLDRAEIGGYGAFLSWLDCRKKAYTPKARDLGIDYPRGAILLGLPGTGKSVVAAAAGKLLGLPVYVFDIAAVFDKHVGGSEQRMRDALKQVDAQQGCVLLIDEADKALSGNSGGGGGGDNGVSQRVFGALLTWLAAKTSPTFPIMTLNRTAGLPDELLRPGRFDAIFYTALPTPSERKEILDIHLRKRGVEPGSLGFANSDWDVLLDKLDTFTGAEIEEVVKEARYYSFDTRDAGTPTFEELMLAANSVVPMSTRNPEAIKEIMEFCTNKARPVSTPLAKPKNRRGARDIDVG